MKLGLTLYGENDSKARCQNKATRSNLEYTLSDILTSTYGSPMAEHLMNSHNCVANLSVDSFTILKSSNRFTT